MSFSLVFLKKWKMHLYTRTIEPVRYFITNLASFQLNLINWFLMLMILFIRDVYASPPPRLSFSHFWNKQVPNASTQGSVLGQQFCFWGVHSSALKTKSQLVQFVSKNYASILIPCFGFLNLPSSSDVGKTNKKCVCRSLGLTSSVWVLSSHASFGHCSRRRYQCSIWLSRLSRCH